MNRRREKALMSTLQACPAASGLFSETAEGPTPAGARNAPRAERRTSALRDLPQPGLREDRDAGRQLGPRGRIWSSAVQNYPPPLPALYQKPYEPYAVAAVDLRDGLRVMGRVETDDPENVPVGAEVELVIEALGSDDDGNEIVSWMFKPL